MEALHRLILPNLLHVTEKRTQIALNTFSYLFSTDTPGGGQEKLYPSPTFKEGIKEAHVVMNTGCCMSLMNH